MSNLSITPDSSYHDWDWQLHGSCRDYDTEIFFHPEGERGSTRRKRAATAKAICATCPVMAECREYALANNEPYGVWGGLTQEERKELALQRRLLARN